MSLKSEEVQVADEAQSERSESSDKPALRELEQGSLEVKFW